MTFIAALRCDRIEAPFVFDQPINAVSFIAWVEQQLCPTLRPGDVVIMDNLSSHKRPAVRAAIRAKGRKAPLPSTIQSGPQPDRAPGHLQLPTDLSGRGAAPRIWALR